MKTSAAREQKPVLIPRSVFYALALLVGSTVVAYGAGRGGGGGGYARGGAASTGSFSGGAVVGRTGDGSRAAAAARAVDNRQDIDNRRDNVDIGHRDHPVAAGAVAARAVDNRRDYVGGSGGTYYTELPCSRSETYVDGVTYYACGTTYYVQSYSGGSLVYVPSPPPPGY
jgi:hypothetical protein